MLNLLLFSMIVFASSQIVTNEEIFKPLRTALDKVPFINKLINCGNCFSFWMGMVFSFVLNFSATYLLLKVFIAGLLGYTSHRFWLKITKLF